MRLLRTASSTAIALLCGAAVAGKPHVHGAGALDVAIDGERLTIALEMPADAALGFERAPRNATEKAAVAAMLGTLRDGAALFKPNPEARCLLTGAKVTTPFAENTREEHADIDASYEFRCASPAALKSVETTVFARFRQLYRLEARRVGPNGQAASRLAPKDPVLRW